MHFLAALAIFSVLATAESNTCSVIIKDQLPHNEPVYLLEKASGKHILYEPTNENLEVNQGDRLVLFCPGMKNTVIDSNSDIESIACSRSFKQTLEQTSCNKQVTGNLQTTTTTCSMNGRNGHIYQIGYKVGKEFIQLFEVCYDYDTAVALYSHHHVNGKAIKGAMKESQRVNFNKIGTPGDAKAVESYHIQSQITHFNKELGRPQRYFTKTSYLARGHLSPDADFIFSSGQYATFFLVNTVPTFQSINNGNWKSVEMKTRKLADQEQTNLEIYTGGLGQLSLLGHTGDDVLLYLGANNKIEVPEYIFKIVYNPKRRAAIAFVTSNNAFMERNKFQPFCSDVCDVANLGFKQSAKQGFTFCCSYEQFSKFVTIRALNVDQLLTLKKS